MKISKFNSVLKMKTKRYLLYAIGEVLLIVIGILLALYINNRNIDQQYKKRIDNNIIRVYSELEKNIENTRTTIERMRTRDSLIFLVMNDSLIAKDYHENIDLAFLIVNNDQIFIEDKSFQNLISLNVSDNRYNDDLLINLKELYFINNGVQSSSERTTEFITELTGILSKEIKSFGDLTYREFLNDDAVNYFLTSQEYKTYVSRYAIRALRNQLTSNREFYKKALGVYHQISKQYDLENKHEFHFTESMISKFQGKYVFEVPNDNDTIQAKVENDSLFIAQGNGNGTYLVPLDENRFFLEGEGQKRYFISFFESENADWNMNIHLMAQRPLYKKIKGK